MEASALLEQSSQVKRATEAFLEEIQMLSFLRSYGTVLLAGSYALNLMINRDIDVYGLNRVHTQDSTLAILPVSIQRNCFQLHLYYNSFQFPRADKPPGYYIGIKTPFRGNKWRVDMWYLHAGLPARIQLMQEVEQLGDTGKRALLRFKQLVLEKGLDIGSMATYEAVLQKHITDEQAFSGLSCTTVIYSSNRLHYII